MPENVASGDILLSPGKAAEVLGVSRKSVQRWMDLGILEVAQTIGSLRLARAADVDALKALRGGRRRVPLASLKDGAA